mmetsp:Transcript_35400/g.69435  ORF Transcript_35400/g.69435 Transcript_35400/m.69435 type:complete len:135 (+) Transcript_35400:667-1071(+)
MLDFKATYTGGESHQWVLIYIAEAHASDTWPMKWSVEWPRPKTLNIRINYAITCSKDLNLNSDFTVLVDGMDDAFNSAFGSWPTAYYVVSPKAKLLYIGDCKEDCDTYDVDEMFNFLADLDSPMNRDGFEGSLL